MSTILDNAKNKTKCQKFTPTYLAEEMLDIIGYKHGVCGQKVLENSFGSGNILAAIVKRYIIDSIHAGISPGNISENLSNDIYGIELDRILYNQCLERLNKIAIEYGIPSVRWSLFNENALAWTTTLRFDYIVGNPPYINYKIFFKESEMNLVSRPYFISKLKSPTVHCIKLKQKEYS